MLSKIKSVGSQLAAKTKTAAQSSPDQYVVALDVGTEFIKALVAKVDGSAVEIVGVGRAHQGLSDMQAGAIADIGGVVQNCNDALAKAEEMAGVSVRTAVLGIAGELVKGTTTTVPCRRKDPELEIDIDEMEQIIKLAQERASTHAKENLALELGNNQLDVRLVNSALVGITIDGYQVTNPIGFKGRDMSVQLYTAFAPMIHIAALERTAKELDLDLLAVAAEPFAVARSVIGDNPNASMSAVLMDVGGGTTDIAVVNDGGVQGTQMFGIGGRAFTRSIERDLGTDFEHAEKLKLSISENTLPPKQHDAVTKALDKTCDVWVAGVELALSEFTELDHVPHRILLCGGGASLQSVTNALEETNWYSEVPFTRKPTIAFITPDQVVGITDKTGEVNDHTYITAMGLLRVAADTFQQQSGDADTGGSIREKFDRMLRV
ncbi:MAG: cell division FtsA domain-containing protein [Candidatus Saccharimonadales bacterium]